MIDNEPYLKDRTIIMSLAKLEFGLVKSKLLTIYPQELAFRGGE
jgi:hypothetical protein